MDNPTPQAPDVWNTAWIEQDTRQAFNTAPVEAVVRTVSYYLRAHEKNDSSSLSLRFLDIGCGAGPNLVWLARKGIRVTGMDISPRALDLANRHLCESGCIDRLDFLCVGRAGHAPFPDGSFDGIVESCVFQHLIKEERDAAFGEVKRLLKPGGLFVGYMLDRGHSVFQARKNEQQSDDLGTLWLSDGGSKFHLTNLGICHFFSRAEILGLLSDLSVVDPCVCIYDLPHEEARRRGYAEYRQHMWTVYAVK